MQRVVIMTPGTSPEIVATLRQAFAAMVKDPEYVAEFRKVTRSEPEYKVGISGEKIVQKLQDTPGDI